MAQPASLTDQALLATDPQAMALSRQQQMADLLTQNSTQQPTGQVISGRYVAPSWAQQLQPLFNAAAGAYLSHNAENKQQALAQALREKQQSAVQNYLNAATPQERFTAGTSQYAPAELQKTAYSLVSPQKLAEGETFNQLNMQTGKYEPIATGDAAMPAGVKEAAQLLGITKPVNEWNPQELAAVNQKVVQLKQAGANNINVNTGQHGFENTAKLGEMFKSEPIYKAHQEINQAYQQVNAALDKNNAAGDLAASIKINKLLDPNSVVRESEVATVANATGLLPKLQNYANKVATGASLNPQQRKEYRQLAKEFYAISGNQYNETRNKYSQIGQQNQLNGTDTILGQPWKAPVVSNQNLTPAMQSANEILGIPSMGNK